MTTRVEYVSTFNWPHSLCDSCSSLCVHSLPAVYPTISGKRISVAQVYSVLPPSDSATLVTLRNVDKKRPALLSAGSERETGNGFHEMTMNFCTLSL